jgi:hypothetical protein
MNVRISQIQGVLVLSSILKVGSDRRRQEECCRRVSTLEEPVARAGEYRHAPERRARVRDLSWTQANTQKHLAFVPSCRDMLRIGEASEPSLRTKSLRNNCPEPEPAIPRHFIKHTSGHSLIHKEWKSLQRRAGGGLVVSWAPSPSYRI